MKLRPRRFLLKCQQDAHNTFWQYNGISDNVTINDVKLQ